MQERYLFFFTSIGMILYGYSVGSSNIVFAKDQLLRDFNLNGGPSDVHTVGMLVSANSFGGAVVQARPPQLQKRLGFSKDRST